jgi:hypothetical protein
MAGSSRGSGRTRKKKSGGQLKNYNIWIKFDNYIAYKNLSRNKYKVDH